MDTFLNLNLKSKLLFIATFFTIFSSILTEKCRSYSCSNLPNDLCLNLTFNEDTNAIQAKGCADPNKFCPAYEISSQTEVKCKDKKQIKILQYPGGPCKSKDDCMNNFDCKQEKCHARDENEKCERHDECLFGYACYKNSTEIPDNTCQKLRPLNSEGCKSEFECQISQGCFNGKCTDYFSLQDGTNLGSNKNENTLSFCLSGHDRHGVCDSLKNIDNKEMISDELVKCDELNPCRYFSINGTITESNLCKCGKTSDGSRYCPIYGGNKYYKSAISKIKEIISNNRTECNTVERDGVCNFYKFTSSNDVSIGTYETFKTKISSFNEFAKSDECIQKVFYPLYNKDYDKDPVDPVDPNISTKCPVFRCSSDNKSEKKVCAQNSLDAKDNKTYVDLYTKSCDFKNEFCNFDRTYLGFDTKESLCKIKDSKILNDRYPGESCETNQNCFLLNGKPVEGLGLCTDKKVCSGFKKGLFCNNTSQCNPGLYCKKDTSKNDTYTCENQEIEGSTCESIFDCKNDLVCYKKKCVNEFNSYKPGEKINPKNFSELERPFAGNYLCKYGLAKNVDENTIICLMINQTDIFDKEQGNLVPCVPDQNCNYTLTDGIVNYENYVEKCECGYNPKGQGYCKSGHNISKDNFY